MDDPAFRERFKGTPIKRAGRDCFVRNVLIACGNSDDTRLIEVIKPLLADDAVVVRAMAVWALSRLMNEEAFSDLRKQRSLDEADTDVLQEWGATQ